MNGHVKITYGDDGRVTISDGWIAGRGWRGSQSMLLVERVTSGIKVRIDGACGTPKEIVLDELAFMELADRIKSLYPLQADDAYFQK